MRSVLPEFYEHSGNTARRIVTTGTVALDANVLLDLYRVSVDQREELLSSLRSVKARLWIPYQVAFEYQKNRLTVIAEAESAYDSVLTELRKALEQQLKPLRGESVRELIRDEFEAFADAVREVKAEHAITYDGARKKDPVRLALDKIFTAGHVGERPDEAARKARLREAESRLKEGIPPGTADGKKDDPTGDAIAWMELLEHHQNSDRPMLFVTNDTKQDWYYAVRGQKIGPLPSLRAEMRARSKHPYHQTTLSGFLRLANRYLGADIDEETIKTVERIQPKFTGEAAAVAGLRPVSVAELISRDSAFFGESKLPEIIANRDAFASLTDAVAARLNLAAEPSAFSALNDLTGNNALNDLIGGAAGLEGFRVNPQISMAGSAFDPASWPKTKDADGAISERKPRKQSKKEKD